MYAVGQNEAPRLPARVRVNGASDAVLWLDAARAARPLPSPATTPTVTEGAAGDLTGAYRWLVAFGSAVMVSYPSSVSALLTVTGKRVDLSVVPTSTDGRVTKRRIYRTVAGGSVYKLVGEIADNVTTDFEDNVADGALTDEYLAVTVFADGDPTDEYADRGRYGNHATQGTAAKRPLFKVGILNGRPVVRFDGSDDEMRGNLTGFTALSDSYTVFVVAQFPSPGPGEDMVFEAVQDDVFWDNAIRLFASSNLMVWRVTNGQIYYDFSTADAFRIWTGIRSSVERRIYEDGTSKASAVGASDFGGIPTRYWLGNSPEAGLVAKVDIAELLVVNRALPDAERKRVEGYLSRKYAIGVA